MEGGDNGTPKRDIFSQKKINTSSTKSDNFILLILLLQIWIDSIEAVAGRSICLTLSARSCSIPAKCPCHSWKVGATSAAAAAVGLEKETVWSFSSCELQKWTFPLVTVRGKAFEAEKGKLWFSSRSKVKAGDPSGRWFIWSKSISANCDKI